VQNREGWAEPQLPYDVTHEGVWVEKVSDDLILVVNLISPNGTHDQGFLGAQHLEGGLVGEHVPPLVAQEVELHHAHDSPLVVPARVGVGLRNVFFDLPDLPRFGGFRDLAEHTANLRLRAFGGPSAGGERRAEHHPAEPSHEESFSM